MAKIKREEGEKGGRGKRIGAQEGWWAGGGGEGYSDPEPLLECCWHCQCELSVKSIRHSNQTRRI